jgi:hypothetical protein
MYVWFSCRSMARTAVSIAAPARITSPSTTLRTESVFNWP